MDKAVLVVSCRSSRPLYCFSPQHMAVCTQNAMDGLRVRFLSILVQSNDRTNAVIALLRPVLPICQICAVSANLYLGRGKVCPGRIQEHRGRQFARTGRLTGKPVSLFMTYKHQYFQKTMQNLIKFDSDLMPRDCGAKFLSKNLRRRPLSTRLRTFSKTHNTTISCY